MAEYLVEGSGIMKLLERFLSILIPNFVTSRQMEGSLRIGYGGLVRRKGLYVSGMGSHALNGGQ